MNFCVSVKQPVLWVYTVFIIVFSFAWVGWCVWMYFMGMRATESLQKKRICLWVIRWIIVLILSVRESSRLVPLRCEWELKRVGNYKAPAAECENRHCSYWQRLPTLLPSSWGLRQVWRPVVSPLHSTGCCSLKLAGYTYLGSGELSLTTSESMVADGRLDGVPFPPAVTSS